LYEDLTATHSGLCADYLYRLPIKSQLTRFRKWKALKVACMEYFDWLVKFRDGNNKGRLHMTSYGSLLDLNTIVER